MLRVTGIAALVLVVAIGTLVVVGAVQAKDTDVCFVSTKAYPGDAASQGDIAKWLAAGARAAGLPPELPVMASLVSSELRNSHADRDSVGFFQMRVGIWNKGEYRGYAVRPQLQLKWFIDHAIMVKGARFDSGVTNLSRDPSQWGEWIADVERPAEQFRGRYQFRLAEARRLISSR